MDRKIPAAWTEYVNAEHQELTITEYMAGCLSQILAAQHEAALALRHIEGILGAIDDLVAKSNPDTYAGSAKVREALAEARATAIATNANGVPDAV